MSNISKYSAEVKKYSKIFKRPIVKKSKNRKGYNLYNKANFQSAIWRLRTDGYTLEDIAGILSEITEKTIPIDSVLKYYYKTEAQNGKTPKELDREVLETAMRENKDYLEKYISEQLISSMLSSLDKANIIKAVSRYYSEKSENLQDLDDEERRELVSIAIQYEKTGIFKPITDLIDIINRRIGKETNGDEDYNKMLDEVKRLNDGETRDTENTS